MVHVYSAGTILAWGLFCSEIQCRKNSRAGRIQVPKTLSHRLCNNNITDVAQEVKML